MRFSAIIIFLIFCSNLANSQSVVPAWVSSIGSTGTDYGYSIFVDNNGNSYITGFFNNSCNFGNGIVLASYGSDDIFIAKFDKNGICKWAKSAGGTGSDQARGITTDNQGNLIITGYFSSLAIAFGNGQMLMNTGAQDAYLAKYDTLGNCIWVKQITGPGDSWGYSVVADDAGNIYTTGPFVDSTYFGDGQYIAIPNTAVRDLYVAKYNSSGQCQWVNNATGTYTQHGNGISLDNSGNVLLTGYMEFESIFGNDTLHGVGQSDIFVSKLDPAGNFLWTKMIGDALDDYGKSITSDNLGNVYMIGTFAGTANFGNGNTLISTGDHDICFVKYNPQGVCQWAKEIGGTGFDVAYGLFTQPDGTSFLTGHFESATSFGNGITLTSAGLQDIFISKFDIAGNCNWAYKAGGAQDDFGYGIAVDASGGYYFTGYFNDAATFGTLPGIVGQGNEDIFLSKYQLCETPVANVFPSDTTVCQSSVVDFIAQVSGTPPFTYNWYKNDVLLSTTELDTFRFIQTTLVDTGYYKCVVSNLCGQNTSNQSHLIVNPLPVVNFNGLTAEYCMMDSSVLLVANHSPEGEFSGNGVDGNLFNPLNANAGLNSVFYSYTDTNNCSSSISKQVIVNEMPQPSAFEINATCGLSTGFAIINVDGGTPPYQYSSGSDTLYNLAAGVYMVTITDFKNCKAVKPVIINDDNAPAIDIVTSTDALCSTSCNGSAQISISGGVAPYHITWSNGETTLLADSLCQGYNGVVVRDSIGCTATSFVSIVSSENNPSIFGTISYSQGAINSNGADLLVYSTTEHNHGGFDMSHSTSTIGSDGSYIVTNVPPDNYILKVKLSENGHQHLVNSYFKENGITGKWDSATVIHLACGLSRQANIHMVELPALLNGNGKVSGTLSYAQTGSLKGITQKGIYKSDAKAVGNPVTGGEIYIELEPDDEPIANTQTDESGFYEFIGLPDSTYSLRVDIPGFPQISTYLFQVTPTDTIYTGLNFIVDTTYNSGQIDTSQIFVPIINSNSLEVLIYPNPHKDNLNISYSLNNQAMVGIEMYNLLGQKIYTVVNSKQSQGNYMFTVNTSDIGLHAGTYFFKIQINNSIYLKKFVKVQ